MDRATVENPLRIAIVGGGIAGLCLAVPLVRAEKEGLPIQVRVYEAAAAFGEIGAGVAFGPNAQRILGRLGIREAIESANDPSRMLPENRDKWFDVRRADPGLSMDESLITECYGQNAGTGRMHRADFLDTLIKKIPEENAFFHKRLESYADRAGLPVQLNFMDGTTAEADVVIGCDGVKSRTRRSMFAEDSAQPPEVEGKATRAKYSGWVAYRGVVPIKALQDDLGDKWGHQTLWTSYNRHIVMFPMRNGTLVNLVLFVRGRKRAEGRDGPWTEDVTPSQLLEDCQDLNDTCKKMLKAVAKPSVWGIFDIPELPWYAEGRVALSGDAAHATTPHQGSGAGQCIESAFILWKLLTNPDVLASRAAIPLALQAYNHVRRPRASLVQRTSIEAGLLYEYQLPGILDDKEKMAENMQSRMKWIWEWDEEKSLAEALDYMAAAQGV